MTELQNNIIKKVMQSNDEQLLDYLNKLLGNEDEKETYKLSEFEKAIIAESQIEYRSGKIISNEEIISKNEAWLKT
jgi:hypothetical protein